MLEWLRRNEIEIVAYIAISVLVGGLVFSVVGMCKTWPR